MPNKIPKGALSLIDPGASVSVFSDQSEDAKPKLKMTVYSGGVIKNHWYWGNLIFDLNGVKFTKDKYPVLYEHETDRRIGFSGKPVVNGAIELDPETVSFLDNADADRFINDSKYGFPFQASVRIRPEKIQRLMDEKESEVINGIEFKGPGTIFRECEYMESSVCVFGADSNTSSVAFSRTEFEDVDYEELSNKEEVKEMPLADLNEFKEKYPEFAAQFTKEVEDKLTDKFNQEKTELQNQFTSQNMKIAELEKREAIRIEKEIKFSADQLFQNLFKESDLPERLFSKVRVHVDHNKFVEDGLLDETKFSEAIKEELKSWSDLGIAQSVQGFSKSVKSTEKDDSFSDKQIDDAADELFNLTGLSK